MRILRQIIKTSSHEPFGKIIGIADSTVYGCNGQCYDVNVHLVFAGRVQKMSSCSIPQIYIALPHSNQRKQDAS